MWLSKGGGEEEGRKGEEGGGREGGGRGRKGGRVCVCVFVCLCYKLFSNTLIDV